MHIAICEDNIADRHQTERLLNRQAQSRRSDEEGYYIDSYGNVDAIMPFSSRYDIFLIDMVQSECNGLELAGRLQAAGAHGYFVLCSSSIDYVSLCQTQHLENDHFRFLSKPIKTAELTALLDELLPLASQKEEMIELRGLHISETIYVRPMEILYAVSEKGNTNVFLTNGRSMLIAGEPYRLYLPLEDDPLFSPISEHAFINVAHTASISMFGITMDDGHKFRVSPYFTGPIKKQHQQLIELGMI